MGVDSFFQTFHLVLKCRHVLMTDYIGIMLDVIGIILDIPFLFFVLMIPSFEAIGFFPALEVLFHPLFAPALGILLPILFLCHAVCVFFRAAILWDEMISCINSSLSEIFHVFQDFFVSMEVLNFSFFISSHNSSCKFSEIFAVDFLCSPLS